MGRPKKSQPPLPPFCEVSNGLWVIAGLILSELDAPMPSGRTRIDQLVPSMPSSPGCAPAANGTIC